MIWQVKGGHPSPLSSAEPDSECVSAVRPSHPPPLHSPSLTRLRGVGAVDQRSIEMAGGASSAWPPAEGEGGGLGEDRQGKVSEKSAAA